MVSKHQLQRSRAQLWVNTSPIAHNWVPSETHRNKTSLTQNFELLLPTVAERMWQVEQICDISSWSLLTEVDEWQYRGGQAGTTASLSQGQTLKRATLQGVSLDIGGVSRKRKKDCSLKIRLCLKVHWTLPGKGKPKAASIWNFLSRSCWETHSGCCSQRAGQTIFFKVDFEAWFWSWPECDVREKILEYSYHSNNPNKYVIFVEEHITQKNIRVYL